MAARDEARTTAPRTIRGPALFIAQFVTPTGPGSTLDGLARWAAGLGFKALQVPALDPGLGDLPTDEAARAERIGAVLAAHGLEIAELAAHRPGQLVAAHPAYDTLLDVFVPEARRGDPVARAQAAADDLRAVIRMAGRLGVKRVATFSGGFAWPFFYPYPPPPAGLVDAAFDALARRWRPLLDAADEADVDLCFELHPGQDLHDGATFERFLDRVDGHPRARILYDPSHMLLQHMDYLGFIDRYHARIGAFHVKDAEFVPSAKSGVYGGYADWIDRPGRFRSVGDGQVDFSGIFDRLTATGYDGWATLEWECCLKDGETGAAEGARFIADHIIPVAGRAFDAAARTTRPREEIEAMLGIAR